ncbi:hypothetical protein [Allorhodopirellula heiligendammensis]|uniref:Lipoprotein n=1 Tax=Allorhodopirellula heiligendammensis TaxID=2714739 RepID=A0A5C6BWM2_9BACT|nr:hypothetical protein [Allorhodopirellula heiligendammensis]TWU16027.1 hypothetical protein Poly21_32320 [Allorhodopirellula heiligendammensis]
MTLSLRSMPQLCLLPIALALCVVAGCRPTEVTSPSDTAVPPPNVDAEIRLRDVFRRYQVASYYDDNGKVILQAPGANAFQSNEVETAPLSVHFDPHELAVEAYTARIRVLAHPDRTDHDVEHIDMTAWFDEPQSSHFDGQVLQHAWRSPVTDRLPLPRVLDDEVLRARLSAGLAGPPPQLEWLLADHPMQKLFTAETEFEWLRPASIDNTELQRISVTSRSERFVFWIDANTSLIRRVELPLPDFGVSGAGIDRSHWTLRLELQSATFQPPSAAPASTFPLPPRQPKLVRAFVPLPPPPPSELIGRSVSLRPLATAISRQQGALWQGNDYLLVAAPPDNPPDRAAWLQSWMQAIPVLASPQFRHTRVFFVSSQRDVHDALRGLPASAASLVAPSLVDKLVRQLRLDAGAMALLQADTGRGENGQVLLSETATNASTLSNVFAVIRDAQAGIDVADRIQQNYDAIVRDYDEQLRKQQLN